MRAGRDHVDGEQPAAFEPAKLSGFFATPAWLRDLGVTSWLLVGVTLFVIGVIWLLTLTQTIVMPVITASVIAAVASPLIAWMNRHRVPRGIGAALFLVGGVVLAVVMVLIVVGGITSETDALRGHLNEAKTTLAGWAHDAGVDKSAADNAVKDGSSTVTSAVHTLLKGLVGGLTTLSSLVFFLSLTALSLFFLLKDGPMIRQWAEGHLRLPRPVAHSITQRMLESLRGYFLGVTWVAIFNAVVVGAGALILGVPLAGTIAVVTFVGAYIPYLGAWTAGAFSVLLALGGAGTDAAIGMAVIQLLANGILQQLIQPIAYGAALGIHPLAVLIVTIGGGALFGAVGLILAAPLTAAITKIAADMRAARKVAAPEPAGPAEPAAVT
jgi:putative heme transporter